MRPLHFLSASICLVAISLAVQGGGSVKKEDVPKYIQQLKSASASDRAKAAEMIGKRGQINVKDVTSAVAPLRDLLKKDSDASVRMKAASALGNIGAEPEDTVPLLIDAVKNDKSEQVKLAAVESLGKYGRHAEAAVSVLRDYGKTFTDPKKDKVQSMTIKSAISEITGKKKK